jgi:hypothetical protein
MKMKGEKHMKPMTQTPETNVVEQLANENGTQSPAADAPQPVMVTPDQAVELLRALLAQLPSVTALTAKERSLLRSRARVPDSVVQASINFLGTSGKIKDAVGQPAEDVVQLVGDANRWDVVTTELKGLLSNISDANLVRRQRAGLIAIQVYGVGRNLALDASNAELRPHVEEIKRLKRVARGRKASSGTPQTPASDTTPDTTKQ